MRINKFVALASGLSRRAADTAIKDGHVTVDGYTATAGMLVADTTIVTLNGKVLTRPAATQTILLNKPTGYVCSRNGQGSATIYDLLPKELHHLKPVGRLDKDSSGLLLLTNDGTLAHTLTHPSFKKTKAYRVLLNTSLTPDHYEQITKQGVMLRDGMSKLTLDILIEYRHDNWRVTMHEGRNRQIRRTFEALGYRVKTLHRTAFGTYSLDDLPSGKWRAISNTITKEKS